MAARLAIVVPWAGAADLAPALAALTGLNLSIMRRSELPQLYASGVVYRRESYVNGRPREQWLTAPVVLELGCGDCEDLSCWRAAELRLQGINARAIARPSSLGWHIVVQYPDGTIEDPSRKLGM
jgi:hypothetical protein